MNDTVVFQKALEDIGMGGREIFDVFRIVAGILKLGNVEFVPTTNMDGTEGCAVSNDYGNEQRGRGERLSGSKRNYKAATRMIKKVDPTIFP